MESSYPRNTVWLIEARVDQNPDEPPAMGSGIVICLQRPESDRPRQYLLTCAHVVKSYSQGSEGFVATGPMRKKILCWPPGRGYTAWTDRDQWPTNERDGIWTANVIDVLSRPDGDWTHGDCSAEKDWVLLDINEASFQTYADCRLEKSDDLELPLSIVGYPGGSVGLFNGSMVENKHSSDFEVDRSDNNPAILRPEDGGPVGPGMSGGGVFDKNGNLVGLYRGQNVGHLSMTAIKSSSLHKQLWRSGYEVFSTPGNRVTESVKKVWDLAIDFGSFNGWLAKSVLIAPLINLSGYIGPLWPSGALLAFGISVTFLLMLLLCIALTRPAHRSWLKWLVIASFLLGVTCLAVYIFQAGRFIRYNKVAGEYVTIGTELTDVAKLLFPDPATRNVDEMLENFHEPPSIWVQSSIDQAESRLARWWLGFWCCFGVAGIGSIALPGTRKVKG